MTLSPFALVPAWIIRLINQYAKGSGEAVIWIRPFALRSLDGLQAMIHGSDF